MLGYLRCPACICAQYNLSEDGCRGGAEEGAPDVTMAPDDSNDDNATADTAETNDANATADTDETNGANTTAANATAEDTDVTNATAATAAYYRLDTTAASHLGEDGSDDVLAHTAADKIAMGGNSLEALRQLHTARAKGLLKLDEHAEEKRKVLQGTFNPHRYAEKVEKAADLAGLGTNEDGFVTVVAACKLGKDRLPAFKNALQSWWGRAS